MLSTNLLPQSEKEQLWYEDVRHTVKFLTTGIVVVFLVGSTLLLPSYLPLYLQKKALQNRFALEEGASKKLKTEEILSQVRLAKTKISTLSTFISNSSRASLLLDQMLSELPPGVSVDQLSITGSGFTIRGQALTRDNLLQFERNLRESDRFQDISFPFSDIIRQSDINFAVQGKLKAPYSL